jgi:hypothetical protein
MALAQKRFEIDDRILICLYNSNAKSPAPSPVSPRDYVLGIYKIENSLQGKKKLNLLASWSDGNVTKTVQIE